MRVTVIGRSESLRAVITRYHAAAIRRQQYLLRISGIDQHVIDDSFRIAGPFPGLSGIGCFPQTLGGSGIDNLGIMRILLQYPRSARGERHPLYLAEALPAIVAAVNSRTCAGVHNLRIRRVDNDRKYIRVLDHSFSDVMPSNPAVIGFPSQVPSPRVHYVRILGIDSN